MSEWRRAKAGLPCGCFMEMDVKGEVSDYEACLHYAAMFAFGVHTPEHRAICAEQDTYEEQHPNEAFYLDDLPHTQADWFGPVSNTDKSDE